MLKLAELASQINACWSHYSQEGMVNSNMLATSKGTIYDAYAVKGGSFENSTPLSNGALGYVYSFYKNSFESLLDMLIIGPPASRSDRKLQEGFGISSNVDGRQSRSNPAKFEDESMYRRGAIMYEKNYCPLLNDVWVLGGVHRCIPFHLRSFPSYEELVTKSVLWKEKAGRMGMLSRELLMLKVFRYCRIEAEGFGAVFAPTDRIFASKATLEALVDVIEKTPYGKKQFVVEEVTKFVKNGISVDTFSYLDREFAGFITKPIIVYNYDPSTSFTEGPWINALAGQIYVAPRPSNLKGACQVKIVDLEYEENQKWFSMSNRKFAPNFTGWVSSYDYLMANLGQ